MSNYLQKSLFCFVMLAAPCINLPSNAMYEDLVKEEIRLTTRLSQVKTCHMAQPGQRCKYTNNNPNNLICEMHNKHAVIELQTKIESTKKALQPFREKEADEALLRKLQIAKAQAELDAIQGKK